MKTIGNTPITYLTKRELFAAMAMQGLLSNPDAHEIPSEMIIEDSVKIADYLIYELNTKTKGDEGNEV